MIYSLVKLSLIFIALDIFVLNMLKPFFKWQIYQVQKSPLKLNIFAGFLCYIILIFTLYFFIISTHQSPIISSLLGFCIYSIFELTTKSLFQNWSWLTVFVDSLWGAILFYSTTFLYYKLK
jgi:uncharacterized membrane protein